jgi:hypothetical protein
MTIEELIKHLQQYDPTAVVAYSLWQVGDVISAGEDLSEAVTVTQEQAEEVIGRMDHYKDCSIGLNWDVLNYHLDEVLSESE